MNDERNKIEALLFASGKKLFTEEITRLCELENNQKTKKLLTELNEDLQTRDSPLMLVEENNHWKITVREQYLPLVRKIVADTELNKSVTETLAVIAWRSPIKQSEIIEIRSNKAYEHIKELEELGFITKIKSGRSYILRLANKFFDYFDIHGKDDIRKMFKGAKERAQETVKKKEEIKLTKGIEVYGSKSEEEKSEEIVKIIDITEEDTIEEEKSEKEISIEGPTTSIEETEKEIEEIKKGVEEEDITEEKTNDPSETEEKKEDDGKRDLNPQLEEVLEDN